MGCCKQLLPLDGRPAVVWCLENIMAAGIQDITVVIGPEGNHVVQAIAHLPVTVVRNGTIDSDMAQSVRTGLERVGSESGGVLVSLVDHPLVAAETYRRLLEEHRTSPEAIVIPLYNGRRGHPTLFPREIINELSVRANLRDVIRSHPELVRLLPVDDPAVVEDMDTPDDYRRIAARLKPS
jgi:molybdenum cofactor cytidylyltransferase